MDGIENLAGFLAVALLIELTPGPNMAFLTIVAATRGRGHALATVLGVTLGLAAIGLLAAFGVAGVAERSSFLYQALRWAGISYLFYLAAAEWVAAGRALQDSAPRHSQLRFFRHGLVVNILNPKAAAFYITVLPTFVALSDDVLRPTLVLTGLYVALATAIHLAIILAAGGLHSWIQTGRRALVLRRTLAGLLGLVALWVLLKT